MGVKLSEIRFYLVAENVQKVREDEIFENTMSI